ncbi:MAG TPA: GNAT family N-acetyltransferase [Pseudomonas xinjiangensis]|uniref:GNAT family N-acetyltransferase n=2 Tax=root TaxID=1 RepID=A0A7V1FRF7_9GAMM|nr:GNAT family N-acetyltransferase [Halopseudomonas xinjiangensis]HEC47734.1 GNAT family N-acetyltransferase [Halopseudomonas xinjiangensis]
MNDIHIRVVDWLPTEALRDIRRNVFIDEQLVPAELEWDADDATSTHFLMLAGASPIGTARLLPDGHIGRVAILVRWRGKGLGQRLMRYVMDQAVEQGMRELVLSAQTQAVEFYSRLGFAVDSEEYLEAGIPHRTMIWQANEAAAQTELPPIDFISPGRFTISNPDSGPEPSYQGSLDYKLGDHRELLEVDEHNAVQLASDIALQARRELTIYAADQATWLFNRRDFIDCCEQLIAAHRKIRIRVLLHEASKDFLVGHSLGRLMHRFPSFCEIRCQHPDLPRGPEAYMLVDNSGILLLPRSPLRKGFTRFNSPDQVKRWRGTFDDLWASSRTDTELRRFQL